MSTVPNFDWSVVKPEFQNAKLWRGERNNNPGNLVNTPTVWQGEIVDGDDERFMQFREAVYGIRAIGVLLLNYERKYGLCTVRGLISRWAPKNENDTIAYINYVCKHAGVQPDTKISVLDYLRKLTEGIIMQENNGRIIYLDTIVTKGLMMATGQKEVSGFDDNAASRPSDLSPFLGIKVVYARSAKKDDKDGYEVHYEDGYTSWSPKDVFEKFYLYLADKSASKITPCELASLILNYDSVTKNETYIGICTLRSAFQIAAPGCLPVLVKDDVDEAQTNTKTLIELRLREMLEFALAWGINGIS